MKKLLVVLINRPWNALSLVACCWLAASGWAEGHIFFAGMWLGFAIPNVLQLAHIGAVYDSVKREGNS